MSLKQADIEDIFNDKKELLLQSYKNHYLQMVFRLAWSEMNDHLQENDCQKSKLRDLLENYSYKDFKTDLESWLISGRMVFGFFGNFTTEAAIETVNQARTLINLKSTKREDLSEYKIAQLPVGEQRVNI